MATLATVADVEAVSKTVPAGDLTRVNRLIAMVSARVVSYTGQRFDEASETITVYPVDGIARLPQRPVTAVASVVKDGTLLDSSLYAWTANGYLRPVQSTDAAWLLETWPSCQLVVTYTHGYAAGDLPADVSMVVAEIVAERWLAGSQNAEGLVSESIDGYAAAWGSSSSPASALSPDHKQVLDAYRRSKFASVRLG
jgi:hypothetical protein